jgi:hypothetical protein
LNLNPIREMSGALFAQALAVSVVLFSMPVAAQDQHASLQSSWIADRKTGCRVNDPEPVPDEAISWSGNCANGLAQGRGVLQWYRGGKPTGGRYEGEYRDGFMNGHGVATFESGNRYDGEWKNGQRDGRGVFTWANGNRFEGQWVDGKRTGWGVHSFDGSATKANTATTCRTAPAATRRPTAGSTPARGRMAAFGRGRAGP